MLAVARTCTALKVQSLVFGRVERNRCHNLAQIETENIVTPGHALAEIEVVFSAFTDEFIAFEPQQFTGLSEIKMGKLVL